MTGDLRGAAGQIGAAIGDLFGDGATAPRPDPLLRPAIIALVFAGGAFCGAAAVVAVYFIGILQGGN